MIHPRQSRSPLLRHRGFRLLWLGRTVSLFGSEVTAYVLPLLAVITLHATPAQAAVLRALEYAPALLVGLLAGAWVDRLRRRPLLIATDLLQASLLLALPLGYTAHLLHIASLGIIVVALSVGGAVAFPAATAFLPAVVTRAELIEANSALSTSGSLAQILGPGLAGGLVQLLTAPFAVAIDALSFLISALALARVRTIERAPVSAAHSPRLWEDIREGMQALIGNRYLRAFVLSSATLDLFWNALMAVYFIYVTRDLRLPPLAFGLIFGIGSIGAFAGSVAAARITRRLGLGPAIVVAQLVLGAGGLLIAVAVRFPMAALPLLTAAEAMQGGANAVYGIACGSVMQAVTPDRLRGRVAASRRVLGLAAVVVGSLIGGVLGEQVGVSRTMIVGAVGGTLAFVWLVVSPLPRLRTLPIPSEQ